MNNLMTENKGSLPRQKLTLANPLFTSQRWESAPIKSLLPTLVGFDAFFDVFDRAIGGEIAKIDSYPPRNVIQIDESNWEVQFAVAGFKRENLTVAIDNNEVIIKGSLEEPSLGQFLFKGIGVREFEHKITVPDNATVSPSLEDGLLRIRITKPFTEPTQKVLEIL